MIVDDKLHIGVIVELSLIHDEVADSTQRGVSGFGSSIAVEAIEDAVAVADVDVGEVQSRLTPLRTMPEFASLRMTVN